MKKLSVLTPEQQVIEAKYDYPATCKTYDKDGKVTSVRVVTHNIGATKELRKLYPELKKEIDRIVLESTKKSKRESTNTSKMFPDKNVWRMMFQLGKG